MCQLVEARANAVGPGRSIRKGTILCSDDPRVKGRERLFRPVQVEHYCGDRGPVEQATAAPGEKRNLQLPGNRQIREWAAEQGYEVSPRGKLPAEVIEAYRRAHDGGE